MEEQARDVKNVPNEAAETVTPIRPGVNLAQAVRRARSEGAARADVVAELRGAELARLEALEDALQPVLEQVPRHVDLFDVGIIPAERPRLFIDVIGFVEMGRDRKSYRFLQDTRHGRVTVVESEKIEAIVEAVTAYIARRLLEREKALASDMTIEQAARALIAGRQPSALQPASPANGNRPAAAGTARVTVSIGDVVLGTADVGGDIREHAFGIPPGIAARGAASEDPTRVKIAVSTWVPRTAIGAPDDRELGVMLWRAEVR